VRVAAVISGETQQCSVGARAQYSHGGALQSMRRSRETHSFRWNHKTKGSL